MRGGWNAVAEFWRDRHVWFWPPALGLIVVLANSFAQPDVYTARVTLQLDVAEAKSPLLQNWQEAGHEQVLGDILHRPELLTDSARDGGQPIDGRALDLRVLSDRLLEITYSSPNRSRLESTLDALAFNFIYELLSPERLRLQQRLQTLGDELKTAQKPVDDPAQQAAHDAEVARLRQNYNEILTSLSTVNAAFDKGSPNALIWFAEPSRLVASPTALGRHVHDGLAGLLAGLLVSMFLVTLRRGRRAALATQENVAAITGLPLLGVLPDLGAVKVSPGYVDVTVGGTSVQPASFAEIVRLHRLLTRNLNGSLVLTSAESGEGTSLLAQLLALRSAATTKKVLLVDLNLKSSFLTRANGAKPVAWKLGTKTPAWKDEIIKLGDSGVDFLPAPSDAGTLKELHSIAHTRAWLDKADNGYEHVIIDTSAIGAMNRQNADPLALAAAASRVALVVLTGMTTRRRLGTAVPQLNASGANLLGVVANARFDPSHAVLVRQAMGFLNRFAPGLGHWLGSRAGV
ncbi:MAG TPA: hypothetical protein VHP58_05240 [Alphaproteobacteria bacterium]|nr:hypothetical protein [Alphaproteobacteria bacterium]